jgi:hypothetical protein
MRALFLLLVLVNVCVYGNVLAGRRYHPHKVDVIPGPRGPAGDSITGAQGATGSQGATGATGAGGGGGSGIQSVTNAHGTALVINGTILAASMTQNLAITGSPSFNALTLTSSNSQLVLQPGGSGTSYDFNATQAPRGPRSILFYDPGTPAYFGSGGTNPVSTTLQLGIMQYLSLIHDGSGTHPGAYTLTLSIVQSGAVIAIDDSSEPYYPGEENDRVVLPSLVTSGASLGGIHFTFIQNLGPDGGAPVTIETGDPDSGLILGLVNNFGTVVSTTGCGFIYGCNNIVWDHPTFGDRLDLISDVFGNWHLTGLTGTTNAVSFS